MHLNRSEGTTALEKAFALFARIVADRGRTALEVIARDLELPSSTAYRLLTALERGGLVCRVGRGRYDVAISIVESLADISTRDLLATIARPALNQLARRTRATVHLGVWEGEMVTYLVKTTGRAAESIPVFTREHTQLDAYCTGIGKVLLSHLPEHAQHAYVDAGPFIALTARTITEPANLLAEFTRIRSQGFAVDDGETADDLYCIAVPLRYGRQSMAALSVVFPRASVRFEQFGPSLLALNACVGTIRRKLGQPQARSA